MAYSEEVKKEVLRKVYNGESIKDISSEYGISVPTIYNWKKKSNNNVVESNEEEIQASKEIERLVELKKYDEALVLTEKYPFDFVIQSQRISILIIKGDYEEDNEEYYKEAKIIGEKFPNDESIQSQMVTIAIKEGDKEGNYEKAKIIGEKFPNYVPIQSQMVTIAIKEVKRKKFQNDEVIKSQKKSVSSKEENSIQKQLNVIKTKLYYDEIGNDDVKNIIENEEISAYKKVVVILAICEKTKNVKKAKQVIKEVSNEKFSKEETKTINLIMEKIQSKKVQIFDWNAYDDILKWKLDENVKQEIMNMRAKITEEKLRKQEEIENLITQRKELKQDSKNIRNQEFKKTSSMKSGAIEKTSTLVKRDNITLNKKTKEEQKKENTVVQTIRMNYKEEILRIQQEAYRMSNIIDFSDSRLTVHSVNDKVPEEALSNLENKVKVHKEFIYDLDKTEIIAEKPVTDFRAKMELILLLRKYGMKDVAYKKLKIESEIYDDINKLYRMEKANSKENIIKLYEGIKEKILQVDGGEYAYKLVERAIDKGRER